MTTPLISAPIGGTPATPPMTDAQRSAEKARRLANLKTVVATQARKALDAYDRENKIGIRMVHEDPYFTPAEGLAALGDDAARICLGSRAATEHIAAQAAAAGTTYIPPAFSAEAEAALAALFGAQL